MKPQLTDKEIEDIKRGLIIAMQSSEHESMTNLFDRLKGIIEKLDEMRDLYYPITNTQIETLEKRSGEFLSPTIREKRSLTEKVLCMSVGHFLDPTLTAGNMITVFDLIEHNSNGKSRLSRLIEEECTIELTEQQIKEATELLEDYPAS